MLIPERHNHIASQARPHAINRNVMRQRRQKERNRVGKQKIAAQMKKVKRELMLLGLMKVKKETEKRKIRRRMML